MNELAKALLIKRNNKTLNFFVKNATSSAINLGFSSFKELLINDSTLVVSDILNFVKKGNDVGLLIKKPFAWNVSYEVDQRPPVVSFSEIIDIDGLMTSAPSLRANSPGDSYFFRNLIANNASIKNRGFRRSRGLNIVAINNANSLGDTVGDDEVFSDQSFVKANRLIVPASFETNNNGNPDGDIVVNNNNGGVTVYAQNYDKPPTPTNIQTTQVGGTFAELDFTLPTHVNDYLGYMIFSNGFYIAFIEKITDFYALGLNPSSSNRVELRLVDEFFNISEPARFSVLTTSIDITALFQNAVAYWKLGNNNIDLINGYNGTEIGTGITRDGEYVDFGTNGAYIEITDNDDFSFVDSNGDNTDFVIKTEIRINQLNSSGSGSWLVSKRQTNQSGVQEWQIQFNPSGLLNCSIFNQSGSVIFTIPVSLRPTLTINTDYTIVLSKKGNTMRYALNGLVFYSETLDPSFQMFNGISSVQLGNSTFISNVNSLKFMGKMKETTILKGQGWDAGEISDNYNNGNGTTIN